MSSSSCFLASRAALLSAGEGAIGTVSTLTFLFGKKEVMSDCSFRFLFSVEETGVQGMGAVDGPALVCGVDGKWGGWARRCGVSGGGTLAALLTLLQGDSCTGTLPLEGFRCGILTQVQRRHA